MKQKFFVRNENELMESKGPSVSFNENGVEVWIFKLNGVLRAFGRCPHMNSPLKKAILSNNCIVCPAHSNPFRFDTGENVGHIDCGNLPAYELIIENGAVFILAETMALTLDL